MIFNNVVLPAPFSPTYTRITTTNQIGIQQYTGVWYMVATLTMQMRDSKLPHRFTELKMTLSLLYLNPISFNVKTGGLSGSTSGNLSTTSTSFSTGFNSGLWSKRIVNWVYYSDLNDGWIRISNIQFLQHFYLRLHTGRSISIVSKSVDKLLNMLPMCKLCFIFASLRFMLFRSRLIELFIISLVDFNTLRMQMQYVRRHSIQKITIVRHDQ